MLSGQLIKDYWEYNVNLVRNAGYALADSVPGQYVYYDFAYGIGEISWKEKIEGHISVIQDTWDALADEATYVCSSPNRTQSFTYGAICELPLSFIKPVTGLIETFDAAYEGEDTATQAIENVYASYDQKMMDAAAFPVDERAYNDGKVPADIAGGIMMGILLDQLTSGMSFFSASPVDELADCALSTTRSELAGSAEGESNTVYRAINAKDAERLSQGLGLEAKNPTGSWELDEHLVSGSNNSSWQNDPWISTTSDINIAKGINSSGSNLGVGQC